MVHFYEELKVRLSIRAFIQVWTMKGLLILIVDVLLCSHVRAAGTLFEKLEEFFDAADKPMQVRVVRSGRVGCEPRCAEWISAEGVMVQGSAQKFGIVASSLRGRKLRSLSIRLAGSYLKRCS